MRLACVALVLHSPGIGRRGEPDELRNDIAGSRAAWVVLVFCMHLVGQVDRRQRLRLVGPDACHFVQRRAARRVARQCCPRRSRRHVPFSGRVGPRGRVRRSR